MRAALCWAVLGGCVLHACVYPSRSRALSLLAILAPRHHHPHPLNSLPPTLANRKAPSGTPGFALLCVRRRLTDPSDPLYQELGRLEVEARAAALEAMLDEVRRVAFCRPLFLYFFI